MKTATHTPGPWAFSDSDLTPGRFSVYHNGPLAYVGDTGDGIANARANARLIAAAPELLAALQALVQAERERNECPGFASAGNFVRATEAARAAIARATGAA